jgi:hypothetical protein
MTEKRLGVISNIEHGCAVVACIGAAILSISGTVRAQAAPPAQPPPIETGAAISPAGDAPSPVPDSAPPDTGAAPALIMPEPTPDLRAEEPIVPPEPAVTDDAGLKLSMGGGFILFFQQPIKGPNGNTGKNFFEVFEAKLRLDAEFNMFGMHIVPILRDTKERGFFPGEAWIQEAYAFAKTGPVTIKAGKVFAQFGRFWDNSFYGNAQEYDGFKLDPNHGISIEGNIGAEERMGLQFFAQYFVIDGTTNYSLPTRDTQSYAGSHRRNYLVGRVEPFIKVGDMTTLKLGLSGGYFQADLPMAPPKHDVGRFAVDATVMVEKLTVWGEYTMQFGQHVIDFPFPAMSSKKNDYMMFGGEYTYDRFTFRYNFNQGNYKDLKYIETRHVPGIAIALDEHLFVLFEYALAQSHTDGVTRLIDSSFNLTIHGKV